MLHRVAMVLASMLVVTTCSADRQRTVQGSTTTTEASGDYCRGTSYGSQVVVYSARGLEYWYAAVLTNFQTNCGVQVFVQSGSSREMAARLRREKAAPYADIIVAEAMDMTTADANDLLEPDGAPGSAGVPDGRCGPRRHWCDVLENLVSFVYNPKLVANPPRTWQDLLAPRFAGQLLLSNAIAGIVR